MSPYARATFCLLTRHGKEQVIAPALAQAFAAAVEVVGDVDTDALGTFTREVPRPGTQLETARRKARLGMERSGRALGLSSEGAFHAGPMGSWNTELVLLLDDERGIEVVGRATAPGHHHHGIVQTLDALEQAAQRALFPRQGLTLRPEGADDARVAKGLDSWEALRSAFAWAQAQALHGQVFFESELRAHFNPARMQTIAAATDDLVRRLEAHCPRCASPGFGPVRALPGLACGSCGTPTSDIAAHEWACVGCGDAAVIPVAAKEADARWCPCCNP